MSERLYYTDSYLRDFAARAIETSADGLLVYLDRTAFYPTSRRTAVRSRDHLRRRGDRSLR